MELTPVAPKRTPPVRDDCWSEPATWTLITAWGDRFVSLNRGNLRQQDWKWVADTVNERHAVDYRTHRTEIQCKNRIDTLKKKYKSEKGKIIENESNGVVYLSDWVFMEKMEELVGCVYYNNGKKAVQVVVGGNNKSNGAGSKSRGDDDDDDDDDIPVGIPLLKASHDSLFSQTSGSMGVPMLTCPKPLAVQPVMLIPQKRPAPVGDDSYFSQTSGSMGIPLQPRQKPMKMIPQKRAAPVVDDFTPEREPMGIPFLPSKKPMVALPAKMPQKQTPPPVVDDSYFRKNYSAVAAAAAAEMDDDNKVVISDSEEDKEAEEVEEARDEDGMKILAKAIDRFGQLYERVETEKQKQMLELEKQRMQFEKDMEVQRMQHFTDTQLQLERIKQARQSGSNGFC